MGRHRAPRRGAGPAPISPPVGTGVAGYKVADYLDQHGRRTRQDQLGPTSLRDALTAHTDTASDLIRLGYAARDRGLYRHAAALWTTAVTMGNGDAAAQLIKHLRQHVPGDITRAAPWAAAQVSLDNPGAVAGLLGALLDAGDTEGVTTLAARAAAQVSLDDPGAVADLLWVLRDAGDRAGITALLARDPQPRSASTTRAPSPTCCGCCATPGTRKG